MSFESRVALRVTQGLPTGTLRRSDMTLQLSVVAMWQMQQPVGKAGQGVRRIWLSGEQEI